MNKTKVKSKLSSAVRELRRRLDHTQESFAQSLGVSLQTVCLWEGRRPPSGIILIRLMGLADKHGYADLVTMFDQAAQAEPRRKREEVMEELQRWRETMDALVELEQIGQQLTAAKRPEGERIQEIAAHLGAVTDASRAWAWRNQR